tara:strand:- start:44163 stop:44471 length:309 start_codon:yes stop_codon:yes gene_type:complete
MRNIEPQTLSEYYTYYLTLHRNKICRRLHVCGQIATITLFLYALFTKTWLLFLAVPFVVYPFAWIGHVFFEKNKPAAWTHPLWAKACDWIMLKDWAAGRIER